MNLLMTIEGYLHLISLVQVSKCSSKSHNFIVATLKPINLTHCVLISGPPGQRGLAPWVVLGTTANTKEGSRIVPHGTICGLISKVSLLLQRIVGGRFFHQERCRHYRLMQSYHNNRIIQIVLLFTNLLKSFLNCLNFKTMRLREFFNFFYFDIINV